MGKQQPAAYPNNGRILTQQLGSSRHTTSYQQKTGICANPVSENEDFCPTIWDIT
jgi:hypothetical protein